MLSNAHKHTSCAHALLCTYSSSPNQSRKPPSKTRKPSRPGSKSNFLLWITTTSLYLLLNPLQNTSSISHSQPVNILSQKMSLNTTHSQNSLWSSNIRTLSPFWNFVYLCFFSSHRVLRSSGWPETHCTWKHSPELESRAPPAPVSCAQCHRHTPRGWARKPFWLLLWERF